jgi:hypothetical protein
MVGAEAFRGQCALDRPAKFKALANGLCGQTNTLGPFRQHQCFAIMREQYALSRIAMLLTGCGPSTVFGRIIAIIVGSVERMTMAWTFAYIMKERKETKVPLSTDANTPASIVVKFWIVRVIAARFHAGPYESFCAVRQSVLEIVRWFPFQGMTRDKPRRFTPRYLTTSACAFHSLILTRIVPHNVLAAWLT